MNIKTATSEQRLTAIAELIEAVVDRCLADDGPVGDTRTEMTADEMRYIYKLAKGHFPTLRSRKKARELKA